MGACLSALKTPEPAAPASVQTAPQSPATEGALVPMERPPLPEDSSPAQPAAEVEILGPALRLSGIDPKSVPDLPYQNMVVPVYIYNILDGDTCKFLLDLTASNSSSASRNPDLNTILKLSLRLTGIDTPEIRAGQGRLPEEKVAAAKARDRLRQLASGHVKIRMVEWDMYGGRCLGDVILPDGNTAVQVLIAEGYGRPYQGEKKQEWTLAQLTAPPFNVTSRDLELFDTETNL
jgi:endonuclease YncB( thermonuclease family)